MNKLSVAEQMGHLCGPAGVNAPAGKYCIRPIMNVLGLARGGFFSQEGTREFRTHMIPGYFWTEWFEGPQTFTSYIDDEPVAYSSSLITNDVMRTTVATKTRVEGAAAGPAMPDVFKGISKYMIIEAIDGNIIEVSPRLMPGGARQFVIDDYKVIDPTYDPAGDGDVEFGNSDGVREAATWDAGDGNIITGWKWSPNYTNRRPF